MNGIEIPDLGRQINVFKPKVGFLFLAFLGGLIAIGAGIATAVNSLFRQADTNLWGLLIAFLLLYLGASLLWFAYQRFAGSRARYTLYERGVQRLEGKEASVMGWDQVELVKREPNQPDPSYYSWSSGRRWPTWALISRRGERLAITNQPRLGAIIVGMLVVHHWPALQRQIENGSTVILCRIQVTREGLGYKGAMIPWSRIKKAKMAQHIILETTAGQINWPEINNQDDEDVLGYLLLKRAIEYYVLRGQ